MARSEPTASRADLLLRDVAPADLPVLFEHQRDPDATRMAALPARDWAAFTAHWTRTLADETVIKRTIVSAGQLAGNIVSWEHDGRREVGYWIGTDFWGRGIATRALSEFLDVERTPLSSPTWPSRTAPRSASCRSAGSGGSARTTAAEA